MSGERAHGKLCPCHASWSYRTGRLACWPVTKGTDAFGASQQPAAPGEVPVKVLSDGGSTPPISTKSCVFNTFLASCHKMCHKTQDFFILTVFPFSKPNTETVAFYHFFSIIFPLNHTNRYHLKHDNLLPLPIPRNLQKICAFVLTIPLFGDLTTLQNLPLKKYRRGCVITMMVHVWPIWIWQDGSQEKRKETE